MVVKERKKRSREEKCSNTGSNEYKTLQEEDNQVIAAECLPCSIEMPEDCIMSFFLYESL